MALPPLKMDLKETITTGATAGSTPFDSLMPWNSIKNYSNHSSGASQTGSASAEKTGGMTSGGGIDLSMLLLIGVGFIILNR
jgi:hypothetical protein